jgi:DNA polymerase-3 subunit alpha
MFTHLHVHSQFSLLESSIRIKELVEAAASLGMESLALTDKYVMNGAVEFYREALAAGIRPILGCEICFSHTRLSHLTLLAKNKRGYENLCQLVSKSHLGNPDTTVEINDLKKFAGGLVCLSGCSRSSLLQLLKTKNKEGAKKLAEKLLEIFGKDFYIEIQRYRLSSYESNRGSGSEILLNFAQEMGIPVVAANNVHYLSRNDFRIYRYLAKIKLMGTKQDPTLCIIDNDEHYLKSGKEMEVMFHDIPQAIKNTGVIAEKCSFDFELGRTILPQFRTPSGKSQEDYLRELCTDGLALRYGKNPPKKIIERFNKEIDIINKTGFAGYFLVVADMARFACENRIPICGKGSAAGSLVSYILRISNVDPVENNLYFERFLNPERKEPPDIDIDISSRDRDRIIRYLQSKYGHENIARVSSFATTKPRASMREAGRILNVAKEEIDCIIKSVPGYNRFFTSEKMQRSTESSKLIDVSNQEYRKIISISRQISGYIRHVSTHPSAFIVSNENLSRKIPLTLSETGEVMSQYDMNSIDSLGIIKIDLINSLSLSLIADVSRKLSEKRNIQLDTLNMDYGDSSVYRLMQKGLTLGVFQLESFGIRTLSRKVKPSCLNDITLLVSLYRPGPQQSGMVNNFIERKFGREKTSFIHNDLKPILEETYGIILYQEQAMQTAIKIAGYSLNEADSLRKAMAHLSREEMLAQQSRFIKGALARGYDLQTAKETFRLISKFASYGFVKAHAAAYAELSYKTCFIKAHYPAESLSTILTNNSGYYSKMQYIEEARRLGVSPRLPDINRSGYEFAVEDNGRSIRVPLIQIRNLGDAAVKSITDERKKNGRFKDFFDFYKRAARNCRITKTSIENLIKIGAFDYTGKKRKELLIAFCHLDSFRKPDIDFEKNRIMQSIEESDDFSTEEKLEMEASILGFYVSDHPLRHFKEYVIKEKIPNLKIIRSGLFYSPRHQQEHGCIFSAGIIISKRIEETKDKKNMMFCTMEDEDGMYEAVFFPGAYQKNLRIIMDNPFVILRGRLHPRDNNISIIAKDAISIAAIKKLKDTKSEEDIKSAVRG